MARSSESRTSNSAPARVAEPWAAPSAVWASNFWRESPARAMPFTKSASQGVTAPAVRTCTVWSGAVAAVQVEAGTWDSWTM